MRAHNFRDLTGHVFSRLTVEALHSTGPTKWRCRCVCGKIKAVQAMHLRSGATRSCGCLRDESAKRVAPHWTRTHGMSHHPMFPIWRGMMSRCYNPRSKPFVRYGGRGITVCERWRESPAAFFADIGERPDGTSLDRINNDGPYCPENCRWATDIQQNNNRRSTNLITFAGRTQSGAQWARELGITKATLYTRLERWPLEVALTTPRQGFGRYVIRQRGST